jgi:Tol biopolymer transport system component
MSRIHVIEYLTATLLIPMVLFCQSKMLVGGSEPVFSPDARRIAYCDGVNVATIGRDGSAIRHISRLAYDVSPSWSPDGKRIVFQSYGSIALGGYTFGIWIIDSNGANPHKLIEQVGQGDQYPRWSPNGKFIAWTHGEHIWIADSSGKNAHLLTSPPIKSGDYEHLGDWSPDSRSIVYFISVNHSAFHLCIIDIDGKNRRDLAVFSSVSAAKWSRRSGCIYYTDYRSLIKIKPDGSDQIDVCSFDTPDQVMQFDISFDERFVVYGIGGDDVDEKIFLLKLLRESR